MTTMTEHAWQALKGVNAETATFPARASFEGEGIVVFRTKDGYRGTQRACPHMQATMLNGELTANDTMVRCPLHVFTFKLSDGKGVNCAGFRIKVYEVRREGETLYARPAAI
ncbi:MAG: Rieske 2Fe-2S domain-containing protein [Proteobacteria bacterium]|nr:Rieske 2Fe-2S domain-containing protein [Pseudomonadota bacterium]